MSLKYGYHIVVALCMIVSGPTVAKEKKEKKPNPAEGYTIHVTAPHQMGCFCPTRQKCKISRVWMKGRLNDA